MKDKSKRSGQNFRIFIMAILIVSGLFIYPKTNKIITESKAYKKISSQVLVKSREYREIIQYKTRNLSKVEKTLGLSAILTLFFFLMTLKRKSSKKGFLYKLCDEIHIIHREKTEEPEKRGGKVQKTPDGKTLYKIKEFVPEFDFSKLPDSFLIKKIHTRVERNLLLYHNGLLKRLQEAGEINVASGDVSTTGFPGEYIVKLNSRDKIEEMEMFKSIGWSKEEVINNIKKDIFPEVDIGESQVVLHIKGINMTRSTIHRGLETFSKFFRIKLKNFFNIEDDVVIFSYQTKLEKVFKFGQSIPDMTKPKNQKLDEMIAKINKHPSNDYSTPEIKKGIIKNFEAYLNSENGAEIYKRTFPFLSEPEISDIFKLEEKDYLSSRWDAWNEKIINVMKEKYEKSGVEEVFLGELDDPNINWHTQIYWKLTTSPHMLIAGQTRSGKTRSVLSLLATLKHAYPKSEFLFADGKSSVDYDLYADKMSDFAVAKPAKGDDPLIELANNIMYAWRTYEKRQKKFEELKKQGKNCTTYVQYNQHVSEEEKLGRFFVVIDEFAAFCALAPDTVDKLIAMEGTIFYYLSRLLRESASFGFTVILASQRVQATDFPTPIRSNLTTWLIHAVNSGDAKYLKMEGIVEKLKTGHFILRTPGLWCSDTGESNFECTLPYIGDNEQDIIELMGLTDREHLEFDYDLLYNTGQDVNSKKLDIQTLYRYIKQAFVVREGFEIYETHNPEHKYLSLFFTDSEGRRYAIGVVSGDEISDMAFLSKVQKERPKDFHEPYKIFFVIGKLTNLNMNIFTDMGRCYVFPEIDYMRKLKEAFEHNKNESSELIFTPMLNIQDSAEERERDLFESMQEDKIINIKELNRIRNISKAVEKGDAFERWYMEFERRMGYDTQLASTLIEDGVIPNIFASSRADGGLDLVRWIDRDKKEAVAIQLKNYTSRSIDHKPIDKMLKTQKLYNSDGNINFTKLLLVCSGGITKQAQAEADRCDVTVIDGAKLEKMIEDFNEDPLKDEITQSPEKKKQAKTPKKSDKTPKKGKKKEFEFQYNASEEHFLKDDSTQEEKDQAMQEMAALADALLNASVDRPKGE